jgi:Mg2+ and Co2+ transporter CorA
MADFYDEPERAWDEYDWERFLQQQDSKTERYMELFEKYIDDPNRDQIIAQEMGWTHLVDQPADCIDGAEFDPEFEADFEAVEGEDTDDQDVFESHPLYQSAFSLTVWIDQLFEEMPGVASSPVGVKLASHVAVASAKLAAALSDRDTEEIGMTIAYLKRALRAISTAVEAANQMSHDGSLKSRQFQELYERIFHVRDSIIVMMGDLRAEWRRRYGP